MNAGHMNQYDIMFSFGNAMSRAPIISGISEVAERAGQQRDDHEEDHHRGVHAEEHVVELGRHAAARSCRPASLPRIGISRVRPAELNAHQQGQDAAEDRKISAENRNWMPMIL